MVPNLAIFFGFVQLFEDFEDFDSPVLVWWASLSLISLANLSYALFKFSSLKSLYHNGNATTTTTARQRAILGVIYAAACSFRSLFPRIDVERTCVWDSRLSYIFFGRAAATVAEVAFGLQVALSMTAIANQMLKKAQDNSKDEKNDLGMLWLVKSVIGPSIFWLSVCANTFCWISVLTKNQLFHTLEESLWLVIGIMILLSLGTFWNQRVYLDPGLRSLVTWGTLGALIYVLFMATVDIPMYYSRWQHDRQVGTPYLTFIQGIYDAFSCQHVDRSFAFWGKEMPWLSGYFIFGVWGSIYLMNPFGDSINIFEKKHK